jgi:uncharacterized protein (TIGR02757 family)
MHHTTNAIDSDDLKAILEEAYLRYNQQTFIASDPICIPHRYQKKEDIEIAAFLIATIAWGNRKSIIHNGARLMALMDDSPHAFLCGYSKNDLRRFTHFVHRTFNGKDVRFFTEALRHIYLDVGGLEKAFGGVSHKDLKSMIMQFRTHFFSTPHEKRAEKHVSNPDKNSSAKRLCMFLRWMVRKDRFGVDFGIWKSIQASHLCLPLDVHTGRISRKLGLLTRQQDDWKAVEEITGVLKQFDAEDPIKYDFALFGLGVSGILD